MSAARRDTAGNKNFRTYNSHINARSESAISANAFPYSFTPSSASRTMRPRILSFAGSLVTCILILLFGLDDRRLDWPRLASPPQRRDESRGAGDSQSKSFWAPPYMRTRSLLA